MLAHNLFKAIMAMLHIADFSTGNKEVKLKEVRNFIDPLCQRSKEI